MSGRLIFACAALFLALAGSVSAQMAETFDTLTDWALCHQLEFGGTVPSGYGAPWNTISTQHEMLFSIFCKYDDATGGLRFELGNGSASVYAYERGYNYIAGTWQEVAYTPAPGRTKSGVWIIGKGISQVTTWEQVLDQAGGVLYTVGYTCQYVNTTWKCGCRDSVCRTPAWQLQIYNANL